MIILGKTSLKMTRLPINDIELENGKISLEVFVIMFLVGKSESRSVKGAGINLDRNVISYGLQKK